MKPWIALLLTLALPAFGGESALFSTDFEGDAEVRHDWTAEGTGSELAIVSSEKAASGKSSLALVDQDPAKYAAWISKPLELPKKIIAHGLLTVSWKQLYSITQGHAMRFSVIFVGSEDKNSTKHFTMRGESPGWAEGQFSDEQHDIPIPSGATQVQFKLSSAVNKGADGEFYLDDLVVGE